MPDPATLALLGSLATNATNVALGHFQNRFSERMSSTAHQRQAADLRKAGINPLLGASGVGAASPVGAQVRAEDSVGKMVSTGQQAKLQMGQLALMKAQEQAAYSQAQLNNAHTFNTTTLTEAQNREILGRVELLKIDTETKRKLVGLVAQHMSAQISHELASALQARNNAGLIQAETILKQLMERGAQNMSEAQRSWFMRKIAPYLGSAKDVAGVAGSVAGGAIAGGVAGGAVKTIGKGAKALKFNRAANRAAAKHGGKTWKMRNDGTTNWYDEDGNIWDPN